MTPKVGRKEKERDLSEVVATTMAATSQMNSDSILPEDSQNRTMMGLEKEIRVLGR